MRVLLCAHEAPLPPASGYRLLLRELLPRLREGHEVRLVCLRQPDQRGADASAPLEPADRVLPFAQPGRLSDAASLAGALLRRRPLRPDQLAAELAPAVRAEISAFRPDVAHVVGARIAPLWRALGTTPGVLTALDAWHVNAAAAAREASGLRRLLLTTEIQRIRRYEAVEFGHYRAVTVVSQADARALQELAPGLSPCTIPNGVDTDRFRPSPPGRCDPRRVVFHGVMRYPPNVTAARFLADAIWPRVHAVRPDAHLVLVGRDPDPAVAALAGHPGVTVTGEVSDVVPWLAGSRAYTCPMLTGTGIKNKLLEALACGLPAVAAPRALQGLAVQHDRDLLVAADPVTHAAALVRLLADDHLAARLGRAARDHVVAHHDWGAVARAYTDVYAASVEDG